MATYNFTVTQIAVPFVAEFAKSLPLILNSNKQLDKEFKSGNGSTMTVTIPDYPTVQNGATAVPTNYASGDRQITLSHNNVSIDSNAVVRALDIGNFKDQVAVNYGARLASYIQTRAAETIKLTADVHKVISATSEFKDLGQAIASIKKARSFGKVVGVLDPELHQVIAGAGLTFFNSQKDDLYKLGSIGKYAGAEFYETADIAPLITGSLVVSGDFAVDGAITNGATSITLDGTSVVGTIAKGQGFTIAGVKAVDIYGQALSSDYVFVAQEDATAAGNEITITIKPVTTVKPLSNVSALPADGAAVSLLQDANSTYLCGVIYDTMGFIHGNAKFAPISGMEQKEMKVAGSLSITTSRGPDPIHFKEIVRWDNLSSELLVRTNWASVVWYKV